MLLMFVFIGSYWKPIIVYFFVEFYGVMLPKLTKRPMSLSLYYHVD